jgi:nucleoside-diphosphate-sugar epimerase
VILGGTGASGRAVATELSGAGWEVVCTGRDPGRFPATLRERGVRFVAADRHDPHGLRAALAGGADLVVDCVCYSAQHARALLEQRQAIGSVVMLSSKAVYVDGKGRHSNSDSPPRFDRPVSERQPVLEPDFSGAYRSRSGYGPNKVAAELTLLDGDLPVSILRPSLIHGPGARQPREWFVVKRLLAGCGHITLAHRGRTANHPTAAANLARVVAACARQPATRTVNVADPGGPTAADVVSAIAAACDRTLLIVGADDGAPADSGWTPWANWPPFLLDTTAATELGYTPAGGYAELVPSTIDYLLRLTDQERSDLTPP